LLGRCLNRNYEPFKKCYDLIKQYEGCKLEAYLCPAGIPSIGYGNTFYADGKPVKMSDKITQAQADALLPLIVTKFAIEVNQKVKVDVNQNQLDALVCFTYNVGIGNFEQSTLLKLLNKGASKGVVSLEFAKWNKVKGVIVKGLAKRRAAEATLFVS
jgi:lysozyme